MNKTLYITFLFSALLSCKHLYAGECDGYNESFNNNYHVLYVSDDQVLITAKDESKNLNIQLSLGDTFQGAQDHHSNINYKLGAVHQNSAIFIFMSKFDARSFGGKITECKGEIIAKYKNA